jgi:hypothetical protein
MLTAALGPETLPALAALGLVTALWRCPWLRTKNREQRTKRFAEFVLCPLFFVLQLFCVLQRLRRAGRTGTGAGIGR